MRYILPLLFCLSCFAQPSPINRRALVLSGLASSAMTPRTINGNLAYWWESLDAAAINDVVTNWIDRVQGMPATNLASIGPTNRTTGVTFNNGQYLHFTNSLIFAGGTSSNVIWMQFTIRTNDGSFHQHWITRYEGETAGSDWPLIYWGQFFWADVSFQEVTSDVGTPTDWRLLMTGVGPTGTRGFTWTNNVQARTSINYPAPIWNAMGTNKVGAGRWLRNGSIRRLCIWTNTAFDATMRSNIDYYGVNTP